MHPARVVAVQEVPRRPQHVRAQDLAVVDRGRDGCGIRAPFVRHPRGEPPLGGHELLRLHRDEPAHDLGAPIASNGAAQSLHAQPELSQRRDVHRYDTSRPPGRRAADDGRDRRRCASSTSPPCHHSSDLGRPDRGDVVEGCPDERIARRARQELADLRRDVVERCRESQDRLDELGERDHDDDRRDLVGDERAEADADRAPERHREHAAPDERPGVARVEPGVEAEGRERRGAGADRRGERDHAEAGADDELRHELRR